MQFDDKRNVLRTGPPLHPGETEITPAMVETVRQRIKGAGGIITVWAVLNEDVYESQFGDGFYLHVSGIALDSAGAQRLADLSGSSELEKWHVRSYRRGLENDLPSFLALWRPEEEFTISQFVTILCEIESLLRRNSFEAFTGDFFNTIDPKRTYASGEADCTAGAQ
jgi:hypothetical protein